MKNLPFLGNEAVLGQLDLMLETKRLPHVVVFVGEKGVGKKTLARLLAKTLVCQNDMDAPCGICPPCIRADAGSHPDIRVEAGSGVSQMITVETAKTVLLDAYKKPEEANYNIFMLLIDSKISVTVQNKLLKVFEDPPKNTIFILTCTSASQLLKTIRSRVQIFTLKPPEPSVAAAYLVQIKGVSEQVAVNQSELYGGNIGMMLEDGERQCQEAEQLVEGIFSACKKKNEHELLLLTAPILQSKTLMKEVLDRLLQRAQKAYAYRLGAHQGDMGFQKSMPELEWLSVKSSMKLVDVARDYGLSLERNANQQLLATCFCVDLIRAVSN